MKTRPSIQKAAALFAVAQGLATALVPQLTIRLVKLALSRNFEHTDELSARPIYVRQTRAAGIGLAAAGIAAYAMQRVAETREQVDGDSDTEATDSD